MKWQPREEKKGDSSRKLVFLEGAPQLKRQQSVGKTLEDQLRNVWKSATTVIYKDLPRLAKRITIHSFPSGVEVALQGNEPKDEKGSKEKEKEPKEGQSNVLSWRTISNVIETVAFRLEDEETQSKILKGLAEIAQVHGSSFDVELALEEAFKKYIGIDSKTGRIFRATNQSILFPAIMHLRQKVYGEEVGLTKDVRRPDGWVIKIQLGDANFVTHTRWEQSIAKEGSPEFF